MIKTQNNEIEVLDPKMQGEGAEAKNGTLVKKFGKKRNTGSGMKRSTRFEKIYLGIIFFLMYLPVAVVIIFSFNESKLPVRLTGFSLQWYEKLFADSAMMEALVNSLILGVASCAVSAIIGTLGAVGLSRIHWKTKGVLEYISILPLMIPEIILGMVLMAFFYLLNLPFGMLTLLIGHTVFCVPSKGTSKTNTSLEIKLVITVIPPGGMENVLHQHCCHVFQCSGNYNSTNK